MDTQDNDSKPKFTRKVLTEAEAHEKLQWAKGENIITIMGGLPGEPKRPIAFIRLHGYDNNKKPILAVLDLDGNELTERSSNLYQLKRYCLDHEAQLTKAMLIKETGTQQEIAPEVSQEPKAEELTNTRKRKAKDNSQTLSH